jgi:hypothetical protein
MSRHFYGDPYGMALSKLEVPNREVGPRTVARDLSSAESPWKQEWEKRIIDDELFLSATYILGKYKPKRSSEQLRYDLDTTPLDICQHWEANMDTYPCRTKYEKRIPELERPTCSASVSAHFPLFTPCQQVVHSCEICPTDFETTIEWQVQEPLQLPPEPLKCWDRYWGRKMPMREEPGYEGWVITIKTYHQLGNGRSSDDRKLKSFGTLPASMNYPSLNSWSPCRRAFNFNPRICEKQVEQQLTPCQCRLMQAYTAPICSMNA